MKTLRQQLSGYAAYHRDSRNIVTHFVGIPLIVFAVEVLLARPLMNTGGWVWSPAAVAVAVTAAYYLKLDRRYGLVMTVLLALGLAAAHRIGQMPTATWLAVGLGCFIVGWIIQFVGHVFEGRKPAFVDDLMGLVIGPLFVVAEAGFLLGLRREVQAQVEADAGPIRHGRAVA